MLKKLLKYDIQNAFKFLIIFYFLALFFAVVTRIFFSIQNSFIMNIIAQICSGITISMIFNILINNILRIWVRFKTNLYGDESYLSHTLPITKQTHYLSKLFSAVISMLISIAVITLTLFIAYYSKENFEFIKNIILPISDAYDISIVLIIFEFLFILFLEFVSILQFGFTGIILGNRMNNGKTGFSFLFGFIAYMLSQSLVFIAIFIMALFNKDIMNMFTTSSSINIAPVIDIIIIAAIVIYSALCIIGCFINIKLFKKGVNVD